MPLPDPHANEPTAEVDRNLIKRIAEAKANMEGWEKEYRRLQAELRDQIGDAFAATVDGEKVYTNRPRDQYAEAALIKAYPDLTSHFMEYRTREVFNLEKFREAHPEIAEQYRVRALVEVKGL